MVRNPSPFHWLLWVVLASFAKADSDPGDEFSNNLFSDLAPLLALFGEQVAKQYLSQSLSWLDSVIFAMGPLGIITAIVSAIRVGGPRWLRAVVGRARESKGAAELELMSSTSADVCELWNGETIVRTLGSPYITEIIYLEKIDPTEKIEASDGNLSDYLPVDSSEHLLDDFMTPLHVYPEDPTKSLQEYGGLYSLQDARDKSIVRSEQKGNGLDDNLAATTLLANDVFELDAGLSPEATLAATTGLYNLEGQDRMPMTTTCPPNLSLNACGKLTSQAELFVFALCTSLLQAGAFAFQAVVTYLRPLNENFTKGGQKVGAFACPLTIIGGSLVVLGMLICATVVQNRSDEDKWHIHNRGVKPGYRLRIAWLQRHQVVTDQNFGAFCLFAPPNRRHFISSQFRSNHPTQEVWVIIGTVISVVGFVAQFTGLRNMHYSATLAQLTATVIASALRILLRRQLGNRPLLEPVPDGHELDWMAKKITRCDRWSVKPLGPPNEGGDPGTFYSRCRLRQICPWPLEDLSIQSAAESLARSLEEVTNFLYTSSIELKPLAKTLSRFTFPIHITYTSAGSFEPKLATIGIELYRQYLVNDRFSVDSWTGWKVNKDSLEAILTLWALDLKKAEEAPDTGFNERGKSLVLLGPCSDFNPLDYDIFIGNSAKCIRMQNGMGSLGTSQFPVPEHRVFGYIGQKLYGDHFATFSFSPIPDLCVRQIVSCYFHQACQLIQRFNGQTTAFRGMNITTDDSILRMDNSNLDSIIDILHANNIPGSREDLLLAIVPILQNDETLLKIYDVFAKIISDVQLAENSGMRPRISKEVLFHIFENALKQLQERNHFAHVGDLIFGLLDACMNTLGDTHPWTKDALLLAHRCCQGLGVRISCELELQDKYEIRSLLQVCENLSSLCEVVLGSDHLDSIMFRRLHITAQAKIGPYREPVSSDQVAELPGDETFTRVRPQSQETMPTLEPGPQPAPEIIDQNSFETEIMSLSPNFDLSWLGNEPYPVSLWRFVKSQSLKEINDWLKFSSSSVNLALPTFILATACGYSKVVVLCLTKYKSICCYSSFAGNASYAKALILATLRKDDVIVALILEALDPAERNLLNDADPNEHLNCLQIACRDEIVEIASLLLRAGMSPSGPVIVTAENRPIFLAAARNNVAIVSLLIFYGVSPRYIDGGNTFLHYAIQGNSDKIVKFALESDPPITDLFFQRDDRGMTCLEEAIELGNDSIVLGVLRALIRKELPTDIDSRVDKNLEENLPSLLFCACKFDRASILQEFWQSGYDIDTKISGEFMIPEVAAIYGSCEVGRWLLSLESSAIYRNESCDWPIMYAARNGRTDYVQLLIELGKVDINVVEKRGFGLSPVLLAMDHGHLDVVRLLVSNGALIDATDKRGNALIHFAVRTNDTDCLKYVLDSCDSPEQQLELINTANLVGETPWNYAFRGWRLNNAAVMVQRVLRYDHNKVVAMSICYLKMNLLHMVTALFLYHFVDSHHVRFQASLQNYILETDFSQTWAYSALSDGILPWEEQIEAISQIIKDILLSGDIDLDDLDLTGCAPLFYAAAGGKLDICKLFLQFGANASCDESDRSPLEVAIYRGDSSIIKLLVESGAKVNVTFPFSRMVPLKLLLHLAKDTRANVGSVDPSEGQPLYGWGPWDNDVELLESVRILLAAGASIVPTEEDLVTESSLMHIAIGCKSSDLLYLLINFGVDPNLGRKANRSLIHYALAKSDPTLSDDLIPFLCQHGANINALDNNGNTALSLELLAGREANITKLLANGALPQASPPSSRRYSDLHLAVRMGVLDHIKDLCTRYKQSTTAEKYRNFLNFADGVVGETPIHLAAFSGRIKSLKYLLLEGADPFMTNNKGYNTLFYGASHPNILNKLINYGLGVNERQGEFGETLMHMIVQLGDPALLHNAVGELWRVGADFNITNNDGMTPLDLAKADYGLNLRLTRNDYLWNSVVRVFSDHLDTNGRYRINRRDATQSIVFVSF